MLTAFAYGLGGILILAWLVFISAAVGSINSKVSVKKPFLVLLGITVFEFVLCAFITYLEAKGINV